MKIALALLTVALAVQAASITSAQSGNWADSTTWSGGVVPGNGDTAILANGFTVTIPAGTYVVVGSSPADDTGTPAIACSGNTGTGVLTINGTLVVRGPVTQCNSVWTAGAGAVIVHDSSQAATPSTANYTWRVGMVNSQNGSKFVLTGAAGSRITVGIAGTVNTNGTNAIVCAPAGACASGQAGGWQGGSGAGSDYGFVRCYYCNISNWGTASTYLVKSIPSNGSTTDTRGVVFEHTTIQHCGVISIPNSVQSNTWFRLYRVAIVNPVLPATGKSVDFGSAAGLSASATGGDRRIEDSYIEGEVFIGANSATVADTGFVLRNSILRGTTSGTAQNAPLVMTGKLSFTDGNFDLVWVENRLSSSNDSGQTPGGTLRRLITSRNYQTGGGPHFAFGLNVNTTIDGWYAECDCNSGGAGDVWQISPNGGTAAYTYTIKNGIAALSNNNTAVGVVTNVSGSTNCNGTSTFCPAITLTQNSYGTANFTSMGAGGEGNTAYGGEYPSVDSNLVWLGLSGAGYVTAWDSTKTAVAGTYTLADYNWEWNISGSPYYGHPTGNPNQYASAPGSHDSSGDPLFVEQRRIVGFGKRFDSTISAVSDVGDRFKLVYLDMAAGTSSGDPRFNIWDLYNWLRAGYRPRNKALRTAGLSGGRAGAMDVYDGAETNGGARSSWKPGALMLQ
jgi:hypothetical protein